MNREILFRGKRIDNGEWVKGLPFSFRANINTEGIETYNGERHRVDPTTVGQYTGLTDKNGKKIFEGDLVKFDRFTPYTDILEKVKFCEGGFAPFCVAGWECTPSWEECEVIGNIHDNPELLEGD